MGTAKGELELYLRGIGVPYNFTSLSAAAILSFNAF